MHFLIKNNINQLNQICKSYDVKRLYVFGSLCTDKFDEETSDIDLIVELDQLDPINRGEALLCIWDRFEELFGKKVDLLSRNQLRNP